MTEVLQISFYSQELYLPLSSDILFLKYHNIIINYDMQKSILPL